jgi:hypothetical protein
MSLDRAQLLTTLINSIIIPGLAQVLEGGEGGLEGVG